MRPKAGFTLIEISVAIGIAVLLAGGVTSAVVSTAQAAKRQGKDCVLTSCDEKRDHMRIPVEVAGSFQHMSSESHRFLTNDLSARGLQFLCSVALREDDFFRFTSMLPDSGREIEGVARTIRVRKRGADYEVGAQIVEISWLHAEALREYLQGQARTGYEQFRNTPQAAPQKTAAGH